MELLFSKINPVVYRNREFSEAFSRLLLESDKLKIATGYISVESLMELESVLRGYKERSFHKNCHLVIGMHGREGFTRGQYQATENFSKFLKHEGGKVRLCTAFKFHGKVYSFFRGNNHFASIVGSSNLSNIVSSRQWEVDTLFTDEGNKEMLGRINELHNDLEIKATKDFFDLDRPSKFLDDESLMEGVIGVKKVKKQERNLIEQKKTNLVFKIPLKAEKKSNLNVFFGKGRENMSTGAIKARPWYEVEIIVSKSITSQTGYPQAGTSFDVYTDDGWKFKCKISGQNSKNFRSCNDLNTLGRWIKGRLEEARVLKVGDFITDETMNLYGRNFLTFQKLKDKDAWFLDFSV